MLTKLMWVKRSTVCVLNMAVNPFDRPSAPPCSLKRYATYWYLATKKSIQSGRLFPSIKPGRHLQICLGVLRNLCLQCLTLGTFSGILDLNLFSTSDLLPGYIGILYQQAEPEGKLCCLKFRHWFVHESALTFTSTITSHVNMTRPLLEGLHFDFATSRLRMLSNAGIRQHKRSLFQIEHM